MHYSVQLRVAFNSVLLRVPCIMTNKSTHHVKSTLTYFAFPTNPFMNVSILKPRKALNKAFLKVKPNRSDIERFKGNLVQLLDRTNDTESEEFHKNIVSDFLKKTYYDPNHFINTKGRNDLVIHNGTNATTTVGVIIEAKKPTNKSEMMTRDKVNTKAFHELILYYLRERITHRNLDVKHLIVTNINEWFIFDATLFDRLFAQNKNLVNRFVDFESNRLSDNKTDFFYKQIAEPFVNEIESEIAFTYFNLKDYQKPLRNADKADDNLLIALFKLLSPEHLLKLPFANDSNSLDKRFYTELLHIIGLTETKEGSKKLIGRNKEGSRNSGSLLEDAIIQLDSLDKISRLEKPSQFGSNHNERLFNVALELSITWINRILFLKLLEAQLITYHQGDTTYAFLNRDKINSYDDLNGLFFQVLARKHEERNADVKKLFEKVPYLNSSLFEPTDIEQATLFISNLKDDKQIPVHPSTVLKDKQGKKLTGSLATLDYLFAFLNAYDFSSEGSEDIQEDNKTLINASVLGLIFEKINGYKDGSFFTPGFITMYMCRETIRKAVVQKFNETKNWNCQNLEQLYDKIEDRDEANKIVNSIRICDPAVGSGHFLVSALNELIAVKNDLKILQDRSGKRLKEYNVEVVNDELVVTDEDGALYEYRPTNKESQRIQEALFHEKQTIIEECLFGVDINPNSVKICRLRLWIELLKNAYYKSAESPSLGGVRGGLETLPNIDINIKCGNSLVSRFAIDADMSAALKKSKWTIDSYRVAVDTYRNAESKEQKREMERLIADIKMDFRSEISLNDPKVKKLRRLQGELFTLTNQPQLFEKSKKETTAWNKQVKKLTDDVQKLEAEIEAIKANKIYENAFEWRFEFPEVLNDNGDFAGFDVVIGNPPYGVKPDESSKKYFVETFSTVDDIYTIFIELASRISKPNSYSSLITPITWLTGSNYVSTRKLLSENFSLVKAINLPYNIFSDAYVDTGLYFFKKASVEESSVYEFDPKTKIENSILDDIPFNSVFRNNWLKKFDLVINLNEGDNSIFAKLDSIENKLENHSESARGILANKTDYHDKPSDDESDKLVFIGNLNRYVIEEKFSYIKYDDDIKEKPKSYSFFQGERILVRRIISRQFRIMASIAEEEFVCKKDIYILRLTDATFSHKFILGVLNSKLISFYKTKNSGSAKKDDFTQITLGDLRRLPIPIVSDEQQKEIIDLVDEVLEQKSFDLQSDTTELETQIDQLVYKLYDLTEEEIALVEASVKP